MANILLIDPQKTSQDSITEVMPDHSVKSMANAIDAVEYAAEKKPDLVILEMSLAGHSGMEFLYEFRTYSDWLNIPVIVYSGLLVSNDVLNSKSWAQLNINDYLYKPESSLSALKSAVEKALG